MSSLRLHTSGGCARIVLAWTKRLPVQIQAGQPESNTTPPRTYNLDSDLSVELAVSLISAAVALVSIVLTALLGAWAAKGRLQLQAEIEEQQAARVKQEERLDLMNRVRDPVLWAAFDLQSRIYNIVAQGLLPVYLLRGTAEQRAYVLRNTLFLFGQYLAWVEIIRRGVHFLDLGDKKENREVVNQFSKISGILNSDGFPDTLFCVFRGEQRAIGEIMIEPLADGEFSCIGYAEFCAKSDADPSFTRWFTRLTEDINQLAGSNQWHPRLTTLQSNLVDLINLLDPETIRFPDRHRSKLQAAAVN